MDFRKILVSHHSFRLKSREFKRIAPNFSANTHQRTIGFWSVDSKSLRMQRYNGLGFRPPPSPSPELLSIPQDCQLDTINET